MTTDQETTPTRPIDAQTPPRAWWTPFAMGLFCSHCIIAALLGTFSFFTVAAGPELFGLSIHYFWPPALILGAFAAYLWSGRTSACPVPSAKPSDGSETK